jgi:hypothetical protein
MIDPRSKSLAADIVMTAKIRSINQNIALVIDQFGKQREIRVDILPGKGPIPSPGETWYITKNLGFWAFTAITQAPAPPVVTGSRTGVNPLTLSLLNALALAGLVTDSSTV